MKNVLAIAIVVAALIVAFAVWAYGGRECETVRGTAQHLIAEDTEFSRTTCKWPWEN